MKVTVNETKRKYPWVGHRNGNIVLFLNADAAVLLKRTVEDNEELLGVVTGWHEGSYQPCSVTLDSTE